MNPFPYTSSLRLSFVYISIKNQTVLKTKQEQNKSPYQISNRFVAALLFGNFPYSGLCEKSENINPPHW